MQIKLDRQRFIGSMKEQSKIGGTNNGGLHRLALSDEDKRVRDWFHESMKNAGLSTRIDEFGNIFGRREGTDSTAEPVLIGSHLDSQPNGGIYDGSLGVVSALEFVRKLNDENIKTKRPIEIVNWTNEEGSRFQPTMQGSGVWSGELDISEEYKKKDENGLIFKKELERIGYKGKKPAKPCENYHSAIELHIEQGPKLENNDNIIGIVTGIVGLSWGAVTFRGEAEHTGTTPMENRKDALVAAADLITSIRRLPSSLGSRTVGSVGSINIEPNSINIVPKKATVTWGLRDPNDKIVTRGRKQVIEEAKNAAEREGVQIEWEDKARSASIHFADKVINSIEQATKKLGYSSQTIFSGAVHDAANIASVCDTGMIFAVSEGGKSHTEEEFTSWNDCFKSANTLANTALYLANN